MYVHNGMNKKTHTYAHTKQEREKIEKRKKKLREKKWERTNKKKKSEAFYMKIIFFGAKPHVTTLDISGCIACVIVTYTYLDRHP